jgi:hypothetical protein
VVAVILVLIGVLGDAAVVAARGSAKFIVSKSPVSSVLARVGV